MACQDDSSIRDRWARLRLLIIGQLLAAPPPRGELNKRLVELSQQVWRHPISGVDVRFGVSTLERWLALARSTPNPSAVLCPSQMDGSAALRQSGGRAQCAGLACPAALLCKRFALPSCPRAVARTRVAMWTQTRRRARWHTRGAQL